MTKPSSARSQSVKTVNKTDVSDYERRLMQKWIRELLALNFTFAGIGDAINRNGGVVHHWLSGNKRVHARRTDFLTLKAAATIAQNITEKNYAKTQTLLRIARNSADSLAAVEELSKKD